MRFHLFVQVDGSKRCWNVGGREARPAKGHLEDGDPVSLRDLLASRGKAQSQRTYNNYAIDEQEQQRPSKR